MPATNNESLKKQRREEYLQAAAAVFQEKGFNDTKVKDITSTAGTSVGNFYLYFQSKEQILLDLINNFYEAFIVKLDTPKIEKQKKIFGVIRSIIVDLIQMIQEREQIAIIFIEQMSGINKKFADLKILYQEKIVSKIESILAALPSSFLNPKIDLQITANAWYSAIFENIMQWLRSPEKHGAQEIQHLAESLTAFLFFGTLNTKK